MPSTVTISAPLPFSPAKLIASAVQLSVGTPSTSTVQAPQEESSQPRLEPVRSSCCLNTSSSNSLGSTAISCVRPFTRSSISSLRMKRRYWFTASIGHQLTLDSMGSFPLANTPVRCYPERCPSVRKAGSEGESMDPCTPSFTQNTSGNSLEKLPRSLIEP